MADTHLPDYYEQVRETRWRIFDQESATDDISADR
jgi:hypothetical protein